MILRLSVLLLSILFNFTGIAQVQVTLQHDGLDRTFKYVTPSGWTNSSSLPVVFLLHALTQDGDQVMGVTQFDALAESNNFILVYPDGINGAWNANMNVSVSQADDLGFLEKVIDYVQLNLNSDPSRQYLCGMSNGGFMSYKLACESRHCFAAIASVSGTMSDTVNLNCLPSNRPHILHMHGTADGVVSYFGSPTTGISVDQLTEKWRSYLGCDPTPVFSAMPNPNLLDLSYPEKYTYTNCDLGSLELIKIIGGGHQWPGIITIWGGLGTINMDFYSPQIIWDFFNGKTCQTTDVSEIDSIETETILLRTDLMGREINENTKGIQLIHYTNGETRKVFVD
jgi:polyhydroxybutyrate depolymerase